MDSPHAIGFYVSSALSVGGGIAVAFLGTRTRRALALLVAGVGVAGVDASLSAGFAAAVVLVSPYFGDRGPTARRMLGMGTVVQGLLPRDLRNSISEVRAQSRQSIRRMSSPGM